MSNMLKMHKLFQVPHKKWLILVFLSELAPIVRCCNNAKQLWQFLIPQIRAFCCAEKWLILMRTKSGYFSVGIANPRFWDQSPRGLTMKTDYYSSDHDVWARRLGSRRVQWYQTQNKIDWIIYRWAKLGLSECCPPICPNKPVNTARLQ